MTKNPVIVPTVLHIIIPCILIWLKTYSINLIYFLIVFLLSFIRSVITLKFLCEINSHIKFSYFVVFLDFCHMCTYILFSIVSKDVFIVIFCMLYIMGFIWVCQEFNDYLKKQKIKNKGLDSDDIIIQIDETIECCICYEPIIEGKKLNCEHIYHKECIDKWLIEKRICPYCRNTNL